MSRRVWSWCGPLGLASAGCVAALSASPAQTPRAPLTGTYRIAFCQAEPCSLDDPRHAEVVLDLVLAERYIDLKGVPEDAVRVLKGPRRDGAGNGCFGLQQSSLAPQTYAGIGGASLITWFTRNASRGEIEVMLYRSPDAGYSARATITDGQVRGAGRADGIGGGEPPSFWGDDILAGRRIGPPDLTPCVNAALQRAARVRGGFMRHAVNAIPDFDAGTATALEATPTQRYIVWLSGLLLLPPPNWERFNTTFRAGITDIGQLGSEPDIWTIGASARMRDRTGYADEAVTRVRTLRDRGVPAAHITVLGAGASTAMALDVARRIAEPINIVFVGPCADPGAATPPAAAHDVLDVVESTTPAADRCGARVNAQSRVQRIDTPARPKSAYVLPRLGGSDRSRLDERPEDWLEEVVAWIRARAAR